MSDVARARALGGDQLELVKYEGLGNDFLVLLDLEGTARPTGAVAAAVCDRRRGLGADGLVRGGPVPAGSGERVSFQLWNADGSEAEMSGNGLRCLAHAALDAGIVDAGPGETFFVLTPVGSRAVTVRSRQGGVMWASTHMGSPEVLGPPERCNVGHGQLLVNVGNPHLVVLGPDPDGVDVGSLGPALSDQLGLASGGLNVEFVALGPGPDELKARIWERGVGETLACGTGSVAAAAAVHHWGRVGTRVTVNQPGGAAEVELCPDGSALLVGPSRRIARCWWDAASPANVVGVSS